MQQLQILLDNLFGQWILLIILNLIWIWLLLFHTYDDYKNKSINAVLTILTVIIFIIIWFLYNIPYQDVLTIILLFIIFVYLLSVFVRILSGDIILFPTYIILFYVLFQNILSEWDMERLVWYWLITIVLTLLILTKYKFSKYIKKNNIDIKEFKELSKKDKEKIQIESWLPALPILSILFVIYVVIGLVLF